MSPIFFARVVNINLCCHALALLHQNLAYPPTNEGVGCVKPQPSHNHMRDFKFSHPDIASVPQCPGTRVCSAVRAGAMLGVVSAMGIWRARALRVTDHPV